MSQTTHSDLVAASDAIGGITESASWYTQRLAERVAEDFGGRTVGQLTVDELIQVDALLREEVTRDHARSLI